MKQVKNLKVYEGMLVVVDMVNGFVREGALHDEKIGEITPKIITLINQAQEKGDLIVFIKDTHEETSTEHRRFGGAKHCVKGTGEEEIIEELKPYEHQENTISIEKNSTSFMETPEFRDLVKNTPNIENVKVCGCCTDICVFNGTMGLANYYDQWNQEVTIQVLEDAIATYAADTRKNYIDAAKLLMEQQGIQFIKKR